MPRTPCWTVTRRHAGFVFPELAQPCQIGLGAAAWLGEPFEVRPPRGLRFQVGFFWPILHDGLLSSKTCTVFVPGFFLRAVCRSLSPLGSLATSSRSTPPAFVGCCGICVFLPPAPLPPIPPGRALSRRGPMACHGEGACAQALTEPRRDYLARLPGGRKTPQQPAGGVEEVATQWCGTQP